MVTVRLRWNDIVSGALHEISSVLPAHFTHDGWRVRTRIDVDVTRTKAATLISEGLQDAIDELDEGSPRNALRALRSARSAAKDLNFHLDDPAIVETIGRLDAYITSAQGRDLGPNDRKILRSGLFNQFDSPSPVPDSKR
jgi:hypothetical protein